MNIFVMNASPKGGSVLLLHLSVMLFGFSAVLGQFVDAPAVVIAGGRVVWSSAALLVFSLVQKSDLKLKSKKDCAVALAAGVVLAVHWTTFFQAIQSSSVAIGTITFSAFPLFLTFLEPQVFHALNQSVEDHIDYTENIVEIEGGNHAQFGNYGPQKGDLPATISAAKQQAQTVDAISDFMRS